MNDGYAHFNRSNTRAAKCALYDTPGVDRHVQEANEAELKAIKEAKAQDSSIEESTLQIETGRKPPTLSTDTNILRPMNAIFIQQNGLGRIEQAARRRRRRRNYQDEPAMPAPLPLPVMPIPPPAYNFPQPANPILGWNEQGYAAPHGGNGAIEAWRNQIQAPPPGYGGQANVFAQPPNNDLNIAREEVRHLQEDIERYGRAPENRHYYDEQMMEAPNVPLNDDFNLDVELNDNARQLDVLIQANRLHGFRADMERRRSLVRRRNSERENENAPLQFPNPAFFNLNRNYQPQGQMDQPQPFAPLPQVQNNNNNQNQQQIEPGVRQVNGFAGYPAQNVFNASQAPIQRANTWRDQFRPATPIPQQAYPLNQNGPTTGVMNRAHPLRRRTLPAPTPNAYGNENAVNQGNWNLLGNHDPMQNNAHQGNFPVRRQSHGQADQQYPGFNYF